MVRGRLRNLVNIVLAVGSGVVDVAARSRCLCVRFGGRTVRPVWLAEDLAPEQARAFVVGKLFSYTCFDGTAGIGRIFADGSVVGTIKSRGQGQTRFAALPAGTIKVDGASMCAHLSGLPIKPCFRVQKIDYRSFRGSISGLVRLLRLLPAQSAHRAPHQACRDPRPAATPIANLRPVLRPSLDE